MKNQKVYLLVRTKENGLHRAERAGHIREYKGVKFSLVNTGANWYAVSELESGLSFGCGGIRGLRNAEQRAREIIDSVSPEQLLKLAAEAIKQYKVNDLPIIAAA